ncbi:MAG: ATP-binding protein, partial [Oscillospiraceae bacterium]|nr:ATP-binding protein [Oscillospiraceae bacterium]
HIETILKLTADLIDAETLKKLDSLSVTVLILSIALHDIGMFITKPGLCKMLFSDEEKYKKTYSDIRKEWNKYIKKMLHLGFDETEQIFGFREKIKNPSKEPNKLSEDDKKIYGEFLRRHHHILSQIIIENYFLGDKDQDIFADTIYGFKSTHRSNDFEDIRYIIGLVARSHGTKIRDTKSDLIKRFGDRFSRYSKPLNIPIFYTMAIVRLADLLDAGDHRAPKILEDANGISSLISKGEWDWNQKIRNIKVEKNSLCIDIRDLDTSTEYIKIKNWIEYVKSELDLSWAVIVEFYKMEFKIAFHIIDSNFFEEVFYDKCNNKFITEEVALKVKPEISKLLIGPLYGDNPTYGVRELLQNAVDACNERESLAAEKGGYLNGEKPKITVKVDTKKKLFTITDNGIGMNKDVIINHYLSVGSSYRYSDDYFEKFGEGTDKPVARSGRFGIGMLAMFLIGKTAKVTTRNCEEEKGYELLLKHKQNDIDVIRTDCEIGTKIEIDLSDEIIDFLKDKNSNGNRWTNWYYLDTPEVSYFIDDEEQKKHGSLFTYIDVKWFKVKSENYEDFYWTYDFYSDFKLFCNGISIPKTINKEYFSELSSKYGFTISKLPSISLKDRFANLSLNISRYECLEIPDEKKIVCEIYKYIIAKLLIQDFSTENKIKDNMRHTSKAFYTRVPYIIDFQNKKYTILSISFLFYLKLDTMLCFYTTYDSNNINNMSLNTNKPFSVIYSDILNTMKHLVNDMNLDSILKNLSFQFSTINDFKKDYTLLNLFIHKSVLNKNTKKMLRTNLIESTTINDTKYFCFDENYKIKNPIELDENIPLIADYKINIEPADENNLMIRVIDEYLGSGKKDYNYKYKPNDENRDTDIWIPFDMEERKKKFPKAFEELKRFM